MGELRGVPFMEKAGEPEIRGQNVYIHFGNDTAFVMPLNEFRKGIERGRRALAEHDARSAEVVPFSGRKKRHR